MNHNLKVLFSGLAFPLILPIAIVGLLLWGIVMAFWLYCELCYEFFTK